MLAVKLALELQRLLQRSLRAGQIARRLTHLAEVIQADVEVLLRAALARVGNRLLRRGDRSLRLSGLEQLDRFLVEFFPIFRHGQRSSFRETRCFPLE